MDARGGVLWRHAYWQCGGWIPREIVTRRCWRRVAGESVVRPSGDGLVALQAGEIDAEKLPWAAANATHLLPPLPLIKPAG